MSEQVNYMKQVFCPAKGKTAPANSTAEGELRCTLCGNTHVEAKRFVSADLAPSSSKGKHFKKGGKPKKGGKGAKGGK